ncbi:hypothetical protein ABT126_21235 [Streptomyces sp. NPDC002012]
MHGWAGRSMWLLAAAVDSRGGGWGLTSALAQSGGCKAWALLHR